MSGSVVIAGAGVVGLFSALYAAERGFSVTVLERGGPDHTGCSLGNAGMVVPSHFVPLAAPGMVGLGLRMLRQPEGPFALSPRPDPALIRWGWLFARACRSNRVQRAAPLLRDLNFQSLKLYQELAAEPGAEFGLTCRGLLMLCKTKEALHEETAHARMAAELGLEAQTLSPNEAAAVEPSLSLNIAGAVLFPQDCYLDPARLMAWLTAAVQERGVRICWNCPVTGWTTSQGAIRAVKTADGEISGDRFVLAAGSWSGELLRSLRLRLPLQPGKGYSVLLPDPPEPLSSCAILSEARVAVTPMGGGIRFGGTMEIGGLDLSINRRRVRGILRSIPGYLPAFSEERFRELPVWSGLRPCSPDGLPYLGRSRRYDNLLIATGHAMMGVSLGPVTGQLVSELLARATPSLDLGMLSPDRYG